MRIRQVSMILQISTLLLIVGCQKSIDVDEVIDIQSIQIASYPVLGAQAWCSYRKDAFVTGGHISYIGGVPLYHLEEDTLSRTARDSIWEAASRISSMTLETKMNRPETYPSYCLRITQKDSTSCEVYWSEDSPYPEESVIKLAELCLHYRIGAW